MSKSDGGRKVAEIHRQRGDTVFDHEFRVRAGRASYAKGKGIHLLSREQLQANGRLVGSTYGRENGLRNAASGWLQHISLSRHGSRHTKCVWCLTQDSKVFEPRGSTE